MANAYVGLNRGQNINDIVENTSTNSTDVELRIDQSKSLTKEEVLRALDNIKAALQNPNFRAYSPIF